MECFGLCLFDCRKLAAGVHILSQMVKGIDEFGGNAVGMLYVQVEKIIFTGKQNIQWDAVERYLSKFLDRLL